MSDKKHHGGPHPVPPGNRPKVPGGSAGGNMDGGDGGVMSDQGAGFHEQDPERRLGNFESAGEHAIQQPGLKNDGDRHSK